MDGRWTTGYVFRLPPPKHWVRTAAFIQQYVFRNKFKSCCRSFINTQSGSRDSNGAKRSSRLPSWVWFWFWYDKLVLRTDWACISCTSAVILNSFLQIFLIGRSTKLSLLQKKVNWWSRKYLNCLLERFLTCQSKYLFQWTFLTVTTAVAHEIPQTFITVLGFSLSNKGVKAGTVHY